MNNVVEDIYKFIEENKIENIFLDADGVIFHSCQAIVDLLNKKNGTNFKGEDVVTWNFKEIDNEATSEVVEAMFSSDDFFEVVKPIKGVLEFMNKYKDKIIVVTKSDIPNFKNKRIWLNNNNLDCIPIIPLPLEVSKGIINMDIKTSLFIDDNSNNLKETNAKFKIQFREYNDNTIREWQEDWFGKIMYKW